MLSAEDQRRRDYAAERIAARFGCPVEVARGWLDKDDADAIETAMRILEAEPYTDIPVGDWYH